MGPQNPDRESTFRVRRDIGFRKDGAVWIPALSAIGAGFAIGLAAIGSGVGQAAAGSPNKCRGHRDTCATPQFFLAVCSLAFGGFKPLKRPSVLLARLGCSVQRAVKARAHFQLTVWVVAATFLLCFRALPAAAALMAFPVSRRLQLASRFEGWLLSMRSMDAMDAEK